MYLGLSLLVKMEQLKAELKGLNEEYNMLKDRLYQCKAQRESCLEAIAQQGVSDRQRAWMELMARRRAGHRPTLEEVWSCAVLQKYKRKGFELYEDGALIMRISQENGDVCKTMTGEYVFNVFQDAPGQLW